MRILIVDDSSVMRKIVTRGLRQAGFSMDEVLEAGNGQEGLDALAAANNDVQLILSDWNMPVMDGLNFVKGVRGSGNDTPIIMVTTEGGDSKLGAAMEAGANGSIKKPFTPDVLRETLGKYFG
jgi:two-component system, chemotaxis family, chemotaxis protein CheY